MPVKLNGQPWRLGKIFKKAKDKVGVRLAYKNFLSIFESSPDWGSCVASLEATFYVDPKSHNTYYWVYIHSELKLAVLPLDSTTAYLKDWD